MISSTSIRASFRLQGAAMILTLALGFSLAVAALASSSAQNRLAGASGWRALLDGRTAAVIGHATAHDLPIDGFLRAAGGVWRWVLFRSGGPQVWVGKHDWLYLTEELRPRNDAIVVMQRKADDVKQVAEKLQKQGIDLLVVLIPDKARMVPGMLDEARGLQVDTRYDEFLTLLIKREIHVVNLAADMSATGRAEHMYYRTDTHWNQEGAAFAAKRVAASVVTPLDRSNRFLTKIDDVETEGPGDLLRLMSLNGISDHLPIKLRPMIDHQNLQKTVEIELRKSGGGLLDSGPSVEVTLIGTSYSRNSNFDGRLQEAMQTKVGNFAISGSGFSGSAKNYLISEAFLETPPKLVVWEIPERMVSLPINSDDLSLESALNSF